VERGIYARWLADTVGETLIDPFAEEWIVRREAGKAGVVMDEQEVARRVRAFVQERIDSGYHGSREAWRAYLELGNRTEDAFEHEVAWRTRVDVLTETLYLRQRRIHPEEVHARYLDEFGADGRRIEASIILLGIRPPDIGPDRTRDELDRSMAEASAEARKRAEGLAARARGGEDFAALARQYSQDPKTRDRGGLLPGRFRPDAWPNPIAAAVLALEPGQISDPVPDGHDWLIFQVVAKRQVTFEEVEKELEEEIRAERPLPGDLAAFRNALRKAARVEVQPEPRR
jgi:hypothetical protein